MKKLMFAVAAVTAGVALADVTSANIVGYQQNQMNGNSRFTMACGTFANVGAKDQDITLADLTVAGYPERWYDEDDAEDYVGGCHDDEFMVRLLSDTGVAEGTYYWIDTWCKNAEGDDPEYVGIQGGWYADIEGTPIDGGAESVKIDACRAMWISGENYKLQSSGEVGVKDVEFVMNGNSRFTAVGNGFPVDISLNDLSVKGYPERWYDEDDAEDYVGGCHDDEFMVRLLSDTGVSEGTYYWLDTWCENAEGDDPAFVGIKGGWYADIEGTPIEGGADKVTITAGRGLWISGEAYTLVIPAPELNK